jgi:4a-hydroxytetrahydrobiopterin dehydratase
MSSLEYRKLSDDEIAEELASYVGWTVEGGQLTKRFTFKTYKDGLVFAIAVGQAADSLNHHPDLQVGYAKVRVAVNTHAVNGISSYDFELARRIETLLA